MAVFAVQQKGFLFLFVTSYRASKEMYRRWSIQPAGHIRPAKADSFAFNNLYCHKFETPKKTHFGTMANSCPWFCLSVKTLFNHLNIQYRGIRVFLHLLRETGKLFLKLNYFSLKEALTQKMDAQNHKSRVINQSRNSYFFIFSFNFIKKRSNFNWTLCSPNLMFDGDEIQHSCNR